MTADLFTFAGAFGAVLMIAAYFASQKDWVTVDDRRYLLANLLGSVLILASLYAEWNLPSAIIEAFWLAISVFGLAKRRRPKSFE